MPETKFFVDAMLGTLAKKLRLLDFDTSYSSNIDDDDLISRAEKESRIIVSKDDLLIQIALKKGISAVLVTKKDDLEQILEIHEKFPLGKLTISPSTTRCPICNGSLLAEEKEPLRKVVPARIFDSFDNFWRCERCHKVYWQGSHIDNLQKFVSELNERI